LFLFLYYFSKETIKGEIVKNENEIKDEKKETKDECQHQWEYLALGKCKQCLHCELKLPINLKERD